MTVLACRTASADSRKMTAADREWADVDPRRHDDNKTARQAGYVANRAIRPPAGADLPPRPRVVESPVRLNLALRRHGASQALTQPGSREHRPAATRNSKPETTVGTTGARNSESETPDAHPRPAPARSGASRDRSRCTSRSCARSPACSPCRRPSRSYSEDTS